MNRPLRVILDARMLLGRFSGVARVVTHLADHLARRDDTRVVALCGDEANAAWQGRDDIEMMVTDFSREHRTPGRRWLWEHTRLGYWLRKAGADVYHATWNSGVPPRCPIPAVLTIHDLIPLSSGGRSLRGRVARMLSCLSARSSALRADRITTVSSYTRDQVITTLGIDPQKVQVVYNGVESVAETRCDAPPNAEVANGGRDSARAPYVLYVGGFEPRKNLAGLFDALNRYESEFGHSPSLVLTGDCERLDPVASAVLQRISPRVDVRFAGQVSDSELAGLYTHASALILLSYDEGFGLPVLEAMAHGCPVIAARRAALPEIVGSSGLLVDPMRPHEIVDAIRQVLTSPERRATLVARGLERGRHFAWVNTAEQMRQTYSSALQNNGRAEAKLTVTAGWTRTA